MDGLGKALLIIFGGVTTLALVSVVISRNSSAPAVIQAGATALASVISAATAPVATAATNGHLGTSTFTAPNLSSSLSSLFGSSP
jgi:hypothetical protein